MSGYTQGGEEGAQTIDYMNNRYLGMDRSFSPIKTHFWNNKNQ